MTTKVCEKQDLVDIKKHKNLGNLHNVYCGQKCFFMQEFFYATLIILVENLPFILFWRKPA